MTSVALLRGINVTGDNLAKMTTLAEVFGDLGFSEVRKYTCIAPTDMAGPS